MEIFTKIGAKCTIFQSTNCNNFSSLMYLVACNSDASVYSLINSPEWFHGRFWYFQLPQLFTLAKSMHVLDRIVVIGYDKSFEDDVMIALNGQEVMSLLSFHKINFEKCKTIPKVVRVM
jgi:hypothetical protein